MSNTTITKQISKATVKKHMALIGFSQDPIDKSTFVRRFHPKFQDNGVFKITVSVQNKAIQGQDWVINNIQFDTNDFDFLNNHRTKVINFDNPNTNTDDMLTISQTLKSLASFDLVIRGL